MGVSDGRVEAAAKALVGMPQDASADVINDGEREVARRVLEAADAVQDRRIKKPKLRATPDQNREAADFLGGYRDRLVEGDEDRPYNDLREAAEDRIIEMEDQVRRAEAATDAADAWVWELTRKSRELEAVLREAREWVQVQYLARIDAALSAAGEKEDRS